MIYKFETKKSNKDGKAGFCVTWCVQIFYTIWKTKLRNLLYNMKNKVQKSFIQYNKYPTPKMCSTESEKHRCLLSQCIPAKFVPDWKVSSMHLNCTNLFFLTHGWLYLFTQNCNITWRSAMTPSKNFKCRSEKVAGWQTQFSCSCHR